VQILSHEDEFDLHENYEPVSGTYFHMNGFAPRLVLTQKQMANFNSLFSIQVIKFHFKNLSLQRAIGESLISNFSKPPLKQISAISVVN